MTRIISGSARGRRLRTPAGHHTRPTSDRVREALFSTLEAAAGPLHGLRFLDLYAGSGAVGLEAASRGATEVTLVEQDRHTAGLAGENARALGLAGVEVLTASVARVLARAPRSPYDVVFADPPYALPADDVDGTLTELVEHAWLVPGAVVVVERATRGTAPVWPPGLQPDRSRTYGETTLWYGRAAASTSAQRATEEH